MKHRPLVVLPAAPADSASCSFGRRQALGILAGGALGTFAACSSTTAEPPSTVGSDAGLGDDAASTSTCDNPPAGVDVGDVSNFSLGTWAAAGTRNDPYIVGQDGGGYFAFSAICTHQGCQIGAPNASGQTSCPCHGARFDGNGAVVRGPARTALAHYAVAVCGNHLFVDSSTTVDPATRAAAS